MAPIRSFRLAFPLALALGFGGLTRSAVAGPMYTATLIGPIRNGDISEDRYETGSPTYYGSSYPGYVSGWRYAGFTGDLNESAQVAGTMSWPGLGIHRPTVYGGYVEDGRVRELGTLGGQTGQALGINDAGVAVGNARTADGLSHAAVFEDGQVKDLGTLGGPTSSATAINNQDQVVGHAQTTTTNLVGRQVSHAFLAEKDGTMKDLGTLGGDSSFATDINDRGQVVGGSTITTTPAGLSSNVWPSHAFKVDPEGTMEDLGTLGGPISEAYAINDQGQVVGASSLDADPNQAARAFLHDQGTMRDLGTLGGTSSWALDINNDGQIVGESLVHSIYGYERSHAFVYIDGEMHDLNDLVENQLDVELARATAINDAGQILVETAPETNWKDGYGPGVRSVLLTPRDGKDNPHLLPPPMPTPEPSTWILFATVCLPLLHRARRAGASRAAAR